MSKKAIGAELASSLEVTVNIGTVTLVFATIVFATIVFELKPVLARIFWPVIELLAVIIAVLTELFA